MTEARITCTCQNLILADLGLRLTNGQIVYVTEMEANTSRGLGKFGILLWATLNVLCEQHLR